MKDLFTSLTSMIATSRRVQPAETASSLKRAGPSSAWRIWTGPGPLSLRGDEDLDLEISIDGTHDRVERFMLSLGPPDRAWRLCFHDDPKGADWPRHPRHHIHLEVRDGGPGPWTSSGWRVPFGETGPRQIVEYLLAVSG